MMEIAWYLAIFIIISINSIIATWVCCNIHRLQRHSFVYIPSPCSKSRSSARFRSYPHTACSRNCWVRWKQFVGGETVWLYQFKAMWKQPMGEYIFSAVTLYCEKMWNWPYHREKVEKLSSSGAQIICNFFTVVASCFIFCYCTP